MSWNKPTSIVTQPHIMEDNTGGQRTQFFLPEREKSTVRAVTGEVVDARRSREVAANATGLTTNVWLAASNGPAFDEGMRTDRR